MAQRPVAGQGSLSRIAALILLLSILLSGCSTMHSATTWRSTTLEGNWVTIQRGDTLGSIARRADVPLVRLMRFNPGADPHKLAVGQRIMVPTRNERAPSGGPYRYQVRPGDTYSAIARHFRTTPGRIQAANRATNPNALRVGQLLQVPLKSGSTGTRGTSSKKPSPSSRATTSKPAAPSLPKPTRKTDPGPLSSRAKDWPWPLEDYRVIRNFGPDSRGSLQPMLLSTHRGSEAKAVADGQVRFANSMRHLGKVVIVHHADNVQSIYALCDEIKVKEGQQIKTGTRLCTVDYSAATERYDLLFDIRHGGKPIDPRKVLR